MNYLLSLLLGICVLKFAAFATRTNKVFDLVRIPFYISADLVRSGFKTRRHNLIRKHFGASASRVPEEFHSAKNDYELELARAGLNATRKIYFIKYFASPVYRCIYCMANPFTWGGLSYLMAAELELLPFGLGYAFGYAIILCGFTILISQIFDV